MRRSRTLVLRSAPGRAEERPRRPSRVPPRLARSTSRSRCPLRLRPGLYHMSPSGPTPFLFLFLFATRRSRHAWVLRLSSPLMAGSFCVSSVPRLLRLVLWSWGFWYCVVRQLEAGERCLCSVRTLLGIRASVHSGSLSLSLGRKLMFNIKGLKSQIRRYRTRGGGDGDVIKTAVAEGDNSRLVTVSARRILQQSIWNRTTRALDEHFLRHFLSARGAPLSSVCVHRI